MSSTEETPKSALSLLIVGMVAAPLFCLVSVIGPGRAISIALRSRFPFSPFDEIQKSVRFNEVARLRKTITRKDFGQRYLVLTGAAGVGKSCLLDSATHKIPGVIKVTASSTCESTIVKNVLRDLSNSNLIADPVKASRRVIFWYRLFSFGRSPIVVINTSHCQKYAAITGAVRSLVEKYKLRVVVDGEPNSLPPCLFHTYRQSVFAIKPMTKESVWRIEELQDLFKYIKAVNMDVTVFAVLGGIPLDYHALWRNFDYDIVEKGCDVRKTIGDYLCDEIQHAISTVKKSCGHSSAIFSKLTRVFKHEVLTTSTLNDYGLPWEKLVGHGKVFLNAELKGVDALIPASKAIEIVLRLGLVERPTLEDLQNY